MRGDCTDLTDQFLQDEANERIYLPESRSGEGGEKRTHTADDVLVVSEVRLAVLAAVNLVAVQVSVVGETHRGGASETAVICLDLRD